MIEEEIQDFQNEDSNNLDSENFSEDSFEENDNETKSKNKQFSVWNYFSKNDDGKGVFCQVCKRNFSIKSSSSTLRRHYQNKHEKKNFIQQRLVFSQNIFNQEKGEQYLLEWLISNMKPALTVENQEFKKFINYLKPSFQIPSRKKVKNDILKMYEEKIIQIQDMLQNSKSKISLTLDLWTASNNFSFIGITAHFVDQYYNLKSVYLDLQQIDHPHTSIAISEKLKEIIEDKFQIGNRIISITSDNGQNIVKGVSFFSEYIEKKYQVQMFQLRCAAHNINLAVLQGFDIIQKQTKSVSKIQQIFNTIKSSPKLFQTFLETQKRINKSELKPLLDCNTRWNSKFLMIQRAVQIQKTIKYCLSDQVLLSEIKISEEEWELIQTLEKLFLPFHDATNRVSTQSDIMSIKVFFIFQGLFNHLNNYLNTSLSNTTHQSLIIQTVRVIKGKLEDQLKNNNNQFYYQLFASLDPRIRLNFNTSFQNKELITQNLQKLIDKYNSISSSQNNLESKNKEEDDLKMQFDLFSFKNFIDAQEGVEEMNANELSLYFSSKVSHSATSPNQFWENSEFRILKLVASDLFAIMVASVSCEYLFSAAANILSIKRNRLLGKQLQSLLSLYSWNKFN